MDDGGRSRRGCPRRCACRRASQRLAQTEVEIRLRIAGRRCAPALVERGNGALPCRRKPQPVTRLATIRLPVISRRPRAATGRAGSAASHIDQVHAACPARALPGARSLPAMKRCTAGSAMAASTASSARRPAGSFNRPRSLPLTCTIISTSGLGHRLRDRVPASARR